MIFAPHFPLLSTQQSVKFPYYQINCSLANSPFHMLLLCSRETLLRDTIQMLSIPAFIVTALQGPLQYVREGSDLLRLFLPLFQLRTLISSYPLRLMAFRISYPQASNVIRNTFCRHLPPRPRSSRNQSFNVFRS